MDTCVYRMTYSVSVFVYLVPGTYSLINRVIALLQTGIHGLRIYYTICKHTSVSRFQAIEGAGFQINILSYLACTLGQSNVSLLKKKIIISNMIIPLTVKLRAVARLGQQHVSVGSTLQKFKSLTSSTSWLVATSLKGQI